MCLTAAMRWISSSKPICKCSVLSESPSSNSVELLYEKGVLEG